MKTTDKFIKRVRLMKKKVFLAFVTILFSFSIFSCGKTAEVTEEVVEEVVEEAKEEVKEEKPEVKEEEPVKEEVAEEEEKEEEPAEEPVEEEQPVAEETPVVETPPVEAPVAETPAVVEQPAPAVGVGDVVAPDGFIYHNAVDNGDGTLTFYNGNTTIYDPYAFAESIKDDPSMQNIYNEVLSNPEFFMGVR